MFFILTISVLSIAFDYFVNPITALSDIGYPEETQVLSNATFRTHCGAFQILPEGTDPRTSYTLTLEDGRYPIVQFTMTCGSADADVAAFASAMPESHRVAYKASTVNLRGEFCIIKIPNLINFIRIRLRNPAKTAISAPIRLPYHLGEGIPMQVDYQSKEFIYFDWKKKIYGLQNDQRLFGTEKEILLACSAPLRMENGTPALQLSLNPGETRYVYLYLPYFPMTAKDAGRLLGDHETWNHYHQKKHAIWDERWGRTMSISLPEKKPVQLFYASQWYLLETCLDQIGKWWIPRANPFQYDQFYMRDGTFEVRALDLIGEHEMAEKCLDFFLESRDKNGRFASQPEQYDANGMALYALGQHCLLTHERAWARRILPAVHKSVLWLEDYRKGGLMPPSSMNDNEQLKNAHIVGHDLWAANGLFHAALIAQIAGATESYSTWIEYTGQYINFLMNKLEKFEHIPPSMEGMDAEALVPGRFGMKYGFDWGNLSIIYCLWLSWDFPLMTRTMNYYRKYYREGLFPYPERGNEDQLHLYLSIDVTLTSLARREYNDVLNDLYTGYLLHTTACNAGCERFDRRTRQYIPPSNVTPHGTFAAKYIILFRDFFVMEDLPRFKRLRLCSFLAPDWCAPGAEVKIDRAPTNFGTISFHLSFAESAATLQILPPKADPDFKGYIFYLPPFLNLTKATCDGREVKLIDKPRAAIPFGRLVELPPDARHVEFQFTRSPAPDVNYEKTVQRYLAGSIKP